MLSPFLISAGGISLCCIMAQCCYARAERALNSGHFWRELALAAWTAAGLFMAYAGTQDPTQTCFGVCVALVANLAHLITQRRVAESH